MSGKVFALVALLVAAPMLAVALDAQVTFVLSDNSAVQVPEKIPLPSTPGNCTECFVVQGGSQNLKAQGSGDNSTTPVLVSVEGAPGGTTVAFVGFSSADCSGSNNTAIFTDFQTGSVALADGSTFPSSVQSFTLCV